MTKHKVLIITGGLNELPKTGAFSVVLAQIKLSIAEKSKWLSIKIKLNFIEMLIYKLLFSRRALKSLDKTTHDFINETADSGVSSSLTADSIAYALDQCGMGYAHSSLGQLIYSKGTRKRLLIECHYIFLSTTFIHDLNELGFILNHIYSEGNTIVIGGALTGSLLNTWQGDPRVKIVAVGYGEYLIPILCDWIRSHEQILKMPARGNIVKKKHSTFLVAGQPEDKNLDFITAPPPIEGSQVEAYQAIHYESVRGCPFRCSFCNYPYLFADNKFRYKSSEKIVSDWLWYSNTFNPKWIVVLDSLFTVPKRRIQEVAAGLIEHKANIKWSCYARANDLCEIEELKTLQQSGLKEVHIGLESGNQQVLDNMNKKTTVEQNILAIQNCRKLGITSITSVIIGFPGETAETIEDTYNMLATAQPDFCFVVVFSTRVEGVPILSAQERKRFKLKTSNNLFCMSPYWEHETMNCAEASDHARDLTQRLINDEVCLDPFIFYEKLHQYEPNMKAVLLQYQKRLYPTKRRLKFSFDIAHQYINRKINRSLLQLNSL